MKRWYYVGIVLGLSTVPGCGNPPPDGQLSGNTVAVREAVVSSLTDDTARASSTTHESAREARLTQTPPLGQATSEALTPGDDEEASAEEPLVVPVWMAKELASKDVALRLQALDRWVQQRQTGSVDPLMLALTDPDERVQERALALIVKDWASAQAAEE
jgi:hypothetical protein